MATVTGLPSRFDVESALDSVCRSVVRDLPDISALSDRELGRVLLRYRYAIEPRFIPWLSLAWGRTRHPLARTLCWENLVCEVGEQDPGDRRRLNHPRLLRDFVAPLAGACEPSTDSMTRCEQVATLVDLAIAPDSVNGLPLMAVLERACVELIPWLREAAERLGLADQTYLDVHSVADVAHAQEFIRATHAEMLETGIDPRRETIQAAESFLREIFRADVGATIPGRRPGGERREETGGGRAQPRTQAERERTTRTMPATMRAEATVMRQVTRSRSRRKMAVSPSTKIGWPLMSGETTDTEPVDSARSMQR